MSIESDETEIEPDNHSTSSTLVPNDTDIDSDEPNSSPIVPGCSSFLKPYSDTESVRDFLKNIMRRNSNYNNEDSTNDMSPVSRLTVKKQSKIPLRNEQHKFDHSNEESDKSCQPKIKIDCTRYLDKPMLESTPQPDLIDLVNDQKHIYISKGEDYLITNTFSSKLPTSRQPQSKLIDKKKYLTDHDLNLTSSED